MAQVSHSLAQTGEARSDQQWIWADIAAKAERLAVDSDTSAMSRIFEAHQPSIDEYVTAFGPVDGQRGAVFLLDGIPVGLDLFQSDVVLRKLMPKLVRSHALDALDTSDARAPKPIEAANRRDAAKAFVVSVSKAAQGSAKIFPTVGLGQTMRVDDGAGAAAALLLDGAVIHLAASTWVTREKGGENPRISHEYRPETSASGEAWTFGVQNSEPRASPARG